MGRIARLSRTCVSVITEVYCQESVREDWQGTSICPEDPGAVWDMDESGIIDQAFQRVKEALDMVKSVGDYIHMISSGKDFNKYSNRLIHQWPRQDNPSSFTLKWASTYIEEQILE